GRTRGDGRGPRAPGERAGNADSRGGVGERGRSPREPIRSVRARVKPEGAYPFRTSEGEARGSLSVRYERGRSPREPIRSVRARAKPEGAYPVRYERGRSPREPIGSVRARAKPEGAYPFRARRARKAIGYRRDASGEGA